MNIASLFIQLRSGAAGGNPAGRLLKQFDLGPVGNSIAGVVGGLLMASIGFIRSAMKKWSRRTPPPEPCLEG